MRSSLCPIVRHYHDGLETVSKMPGDAVRDRKNGQDLYSGRTPFGAYSAFASRLPSGGEPMPKMTGSRYFAEAMRGYGVSNVFYVNSVARGALEEMGKLGVKTVVCHGEKAAAYMADGYARATHQPGICLCQDIGTTNLAAGLRDARMSGSPVIAITGGQNDEPRYRHAYQNAEDNAAWEGVTKANYYVNTVKRF